jgi:hypothetical protein
MADAAPDEPVRIPAREFFGIGLGLGMRCAIGIAFKRDRRHADDRRLGETLFEIVIFRLAFGQIEAPAIIMDDDGDISAVTLSAMTCSILSTSEASSGPVVPMPALLTSTVRFVSLRNIRSIRARSAFSVRSAPTISTERLVSAVRRFAMISTRSRLRATRMRSWPRRANRSA